MVEEGERAHPRSCPRSRKSSRYGQGPYERFDNGGRSGQRHLPELLGEWLPRRCVPEGRPVPAWLVRPVMQEAGRMPLPRGPSFISAVIQAAPAVMPFTIQAAPAVMPATTGVHHLAPIYSVAMSGPNAECGASCILRCPRVVPTMQAASH